MCDWNGRDYVLNLDFLGEGSYVATVYRDGINADRYAADYTIESFEVERTDWLQLSMAPGGGFVVRFEKTQTEPHMQRPNHS